MGESAATCTVSGTKVASPEPTTPLVDSATTVRLDEVLPGVPQAEALPGAVGITMDDVVAGLYGLAAGWLMVLFV